MTAGLPYKAHVCRCNRQANSQSLTAQATEGTFKSSSSEEQRQKAGVTGMRETWKDQQGLPRHPRCLLAVVAH